MSLAFYFDQHVPGPIAAGLRRRGVAVLTAEEDGRNAWEDEYLLERATELSRVMVTNDRDFLVITARWMDRGRMFAGLVYMTDQGIDYGKAIADLETVARVYTSEEVRDHIEYLPL